jgi:hypothetical protein
VCVCVCVCVCACACVCARACVRACVCVCVECRYKKNKWMLRNDKDKQASKSKALEAYRVVTC